MSNTSLGQLTVNFVAETGSYEEGMDRAQRATEKFEKGAKKSAAELDRLRSSIDPLAGQLQRLTKQQNALNKAFEEKKLSADEYTHLNKKLDDTRKALKGLGENMQTAGMSAKQLAFATRQLPMQFTDIFVSLAAGQNPMTVLLQQGGQLKDTFGGIGPAAKAMGSYVLGLVNPLMAAGAAVAGLAAAYYQGSEEADAFREAIVLNGNAAGTTIDQLTAMAEQLDNVVGTQAAAAEVLAMLAGSGKIAGSSFDYLAKAAIELNRATGKAVDETVKEFEKLADDPVKAVADLNEKYNFLTISVYDQIKAMAEAGNETGAAELAMKSYADAMSNRSGEIVKNLGTVESAWAAIKDAAAEAWDAALNIGRKDTLQDQLAQAEKELQQMVEMQQQGVWGISGDSVQAQQLIVDALRNQIKTADAIAKKDREKAVATKEAIDAENTINKLSAAALTNDEKRLKARKEYLANIEKIRKADPASGLLDQGKINKDLAAIDAQYSDKKKPEQHRESAAVKLLDQLKQQQAAMELQLGTQAKIGTAAEKLAAFEQQIADIKEKKVLTIDQKSLVENEAAIRAQLEKNAAIEQQVKLQEQAARTLEKERQLNEIIANEKQNYNDRLEAFGRGDKALEKLREQQRIQRDYQKELEQLNDQKSRGDLSSDQYDTELQMLQNSLDERLRLFEDYYAKQEEMQSDWTVGAGRAMQNYIDSASNIAGMTEDIIGGAFQGLEDVIYDFVATGTLKLGDLMRSIGKEVIQMLIKIGVQKTASFILDKTIGTAAAAGYIAQVTGQATAGVNLAAIHAFASTAAIPVVGPALAPAAAGAAAAFTMPFALAAITSASTSLAGMAHSGIDNIPQEGTWLLDKGERVLSPRQNSDLTSYLRNQSGGRGQPVEVAINLSSVSNDDMLRMLSSRRGEIAGMVQAALADSGVRLG